MQGLRSDKPGMVRTESDFFKKLLFDNSRRKDVESERETLGEKLHSLRKEKERLSAEKMFLYDRYRSGGMTREQFKARTGSMGVRVEEIGKEMGGSRGWD